MNDCQVEILLIEDSPDDVELTLRAFKKQNLCNQIMVARDGAEALDYLFRRGTHIERDISQNPKLILLDLKLPKISGLEVLKAIKENETLSSIPVVIITSSREDLDVREAYKLGANGYVVKPIKFDQFMETMSNIGFYWLLVNHSL